MKDIYDTKTLDIFEDEKPETDMVIFRKNRAKKNLASIKFRKARVKKTTKHLMQLFQAGRKRSLYAEGFPA